MKNQKNYLSLFLCLLNLFFFFSNVNSQVDSYPSDVQGKEIKESKMIKRPEIQGNESTSFSDKTPGDEIIISVKNVEGSLCGTDPEVHIELRVSNFPLEIQEIAILNTVKNSISELDNTASPGNLAADAPFYYRAFREAAQKNVIRNFKFNTNPCPLDGKIYVYARVIEKRCALDKYRSSPWSLKAFQLNRQAEFLVGQLVSPEIKCGSIPFTGLTPKVKSGSFTSGNISLDSAPNDRVFDWYRDFDLSNPNETTDNDLKFTTYGTQLFKPQNVYGNNSSSSKQTSYWRFKPRGLCSYDKMYFYASQYLEHYNPNVELPLSGDELSGIAAFIRYDVQSIADSIFGSRVVHLYNTDNLKCGSEISCRIENLNRFTIGATDLRNLLTAQFPEISAFNSTDVKYYCQSTGGDWVEDANMDITGYQRKICFDHLREGQGFVPRIYKATVSINVVYALDDLCALGLTEFCGQTVNIECEIDFFYEVNPNDMPAQNQIDTANFFADEASKFAYKTYSNLLGDVYSPPSNDFDCDAIFNVTVLVDGIFTDLGTIFNDTILNPFDSLVVCDTTYEDVITSSIDSTYAQTLANCDSTLLPSGQYEVECDTFFVLQTETLYDTTNIQVIECDTVIDSIPLGPGPYIHFVDQCLRRTAIMLPHRPDLNISPKLESLINDPNISYKWVNKTTNDIVSNEFYYLFPNLPLDKINIYELQASAYGFPYETIHTVRVINCDEAKRSKNIGNNENVGQILVEIKGLGNDKLDTIIVLNGQENHRSQKVNLSPEILIYPNPTKKDFTVLVNGLGSRPFSLTILDIHGKTVDFVEGIKENSYSYSKDLNSGIYLVTVTSELFNQTMRLVIK